MPPRWIRIAPGAVTIEVTARPGAQRRGVLRVDDRGPVIGLQSAAERGKANDEIAGLIAKAAGVPRSRVEILRGTSSPHKVLRVVVAEPGLVARRLEESLALAREQCQSRAK
jgi:uncharacterized protein YggU (UPF0235/DUF167 family)